MDIREAIKRQARSQTKMYLPRPCIEVLVIIVGFFFKKIEKTLFNLSENPKMLKNNFGRRLALNECDIHLEVYTAENARGVKKQLGLYEENSDRPHLREVLT